MERGEGKSSWLARRVTQVQDDGRDLCGIVVPNKLHVNVWFRNLIDPYEIDPSRFMIFTPSQLDESRGQRFTLVGVDDADLIPNLRKMFDMLHPSVDTYTDRITITHTNELEEYL